MQPHTTTTTYTTIPISPGDVISRSIHNLSSAFSIVRPRTEFLPSSSGFDRPDSFPSAKSRLLKNAAYFRLNYALIILSCALLSLIQAPLSLILVSATIFLWLVLYLFREDPLILWGRHVNDRTVLIGLVLVSLVMIFGLGVLWDLMMGVGIGGAISAVHGVFRNEEGLALDEEEAASEGLIRAWPGLDRRGESMGN
ncbi:PRA1 family protein G2 [Magnolia sinica]|uniref:PRA1 family protein G2 n=1 Tax=Magnolia sinica TaxID=86752 RepID=UPI002659DA83|nr:PRA1 family protein G2 [Magnolia sinica]